MSSNHISFDELQTKIAIKKFISTTQQMREAAEQDGLNNLSEPEIFQLIKEEKKYYVNVVEKKCSNSLSTQMF